MDLEVSPPARIRGVFGAYALLWLVSVVVGFGIVVVWMGVEAAQGRPHDPSRTAELQAFLGTPQAMLPMFLLLGAAQLALPVWFGRRAHGAGPRIAFHAPRGGAAVVVVACVGANAWALAASSVVMAMVGAPSEAVTQLVGSVQQSSGLIAALYALMLVFGTPFCEEVFFRGFAQPRLTARLGAIGGVALTAAMFGAMHGDVMRGVITFFLGLWLGLAALRTGSVWPAVAGHVFNNGISWLTMTFSTSSPQDVPTGALLWGSVVVEVAVGTGALWLLWRLTRAPRIAEPSVFVSPSPVDRPSA